MKIYVPVRVFCDVCGSEDKVLTDREIPVIEIECGIRSIDERVLDLCIACYNKMLDGNFIFNDIDELSIYFKGE